MDLGPRVFCRNRWPMALAMRWSSPMSGGRVLHANSTYFQLTSKAGQARLAGMDVLYAGYPDFAEPVYQLAQAASAGRSLARDVRVPANSSVPGASPDGARWLRLSVSPVSAASGQQSLWRLTDITADRQGQETAFARLQYIHHLSRSRARRVLFHPAGWPR